MRTRVFSDLFVTLPWTPSVLEISQFWREVVGTRWRTDLRTYCFLWGSQPDFTAHSAAITEHHRLVGLNGRSLFFFMVLKAGGPRSKCPQGWFLVRLLFLACRLDGHCVTLSLQGFSSVCAYSWCLFLFYRHQSYWIRAPASWPYLSLIDSVKVLSLNTVTLGVRASTYNRGRDTVQSIPGWIGWP